MAPYKRPPLINLVKTGFDADGQASSPLYVQLYRHVRSLILDDVLDAGARLPSSRTLARDIGLSRTTVELAYDELAAEGFVERRRGSGTYVVDLHPALPDRPGVPGHKPENPADVLDMLSREGARTMATTSFRDDPTQPSGFAPCLPSEEVFPLAEWNRLLLGALYDGGIRLLRPAPLLGDESLRRAIADHVARTRRVQARPEQILLTASTQAAMSLISRLVLDPGDDVWLEDPGYRGARTVFESLGAVLHPIPVDSEGLDVDAGMATAPEARLAYVTPSHQYPTGVTLSASRRSALLEWAARAGAWILEDDYDSEFRHVGQPLAPLQSYDQDGRVIYLGSFNKTLYPGLRLAYAVLPFALIEPARRAVEVQGGQPSTLLQHVVARYLREGHFAAHLRRMRLVYQERRDALLKAVRAGGETLRLGPSETGLHVCAWLPEGVSDLAISETAAQVHLHVPALSPCYLNGRAQPGLIIGYAGVDPKAIQSGIRRLTSIVERV